MLFKKMNQFFQQIFVPLQKEDYSGLEYLIFYLTMLFCAFLYMLYA